MIEAVATFWDNEFKGFVPEAHRLKNEYKERWIRFHSLPASKRYPGNESEFLEIFRRHNAVLQELCGDERKVLVVLPEFSGVKTPTRPASELTILFPITEHWCSVAQREDGDNYKSFCHLHVSDVEFDSEVLNGLFRLVANDEVRNVMIIGLRKGFVFHPYDGGADVVLHSTEQRNLLKERHREWLSEHPEGF